MQILKFDAYDKYKFFKAKNFTLSLLENAQKVDPNNRLRASAMDDIDRCISRILGLYPFYGEFIYKARFLYDHPDINTMATDGHNIYVSSQFVSKMTDKEIIFVLCHEILHIVFMHHHRMYEHIPNINAKTAEQWNIAADLEINPFLVENGLLSEAELTDPKGMNGLYKKEYHGLDVETIYDTMNKGGDMPEPEKSTRQMPVEIGSVIRTKSGKQYGVVTDISVDGTFTTRDITEDEARKLVNK